MSILDYYMYVCMYVCMYVGLYVCINLLSDISIEKWDQSMDHIRNFQTGQLEKKSFFNFFFFLIFVALVAFIHSDRERQEISGEREGENGEDMH